MKPVFGFADFRLDTGEHTLTRAGTALPLPAKALDALLVLVERAGHLVTREELMRLLWPGSFVADATLTQNVWLVRQALGRGPDGKAWIETARGRGYRFTAAVSRLEPTPASHGEPAVRCRLIYGRRRIPLLEGETIIGRDPGAGVRLDSPTVSRRHARILVAGADATLEDLGSRNGTYLRTSRIEGVVPLVDGDPIQAGSVELVFRITNEVSSTHTEVSGKARRVGSERLRDSRAPRERR